MTFPISHPFLAFILIVMFLLALVVVAAGAINGEPVRKDFSQSGAMVARQAHNLKVGGSIPSSDPNVGLAAGDMVSAPNAGRELQVGETHLRPVSASASQPAIFPSESPVVAQPANGGGEISPANLINPHDLTGITTTVSAAVELSNMGFDVKPWPDEPVIQITDSHGVTFYMPNDATVKECIDRYREKLDRFHAA